MKYHQDLSCLFGGYVREELRDDLVLVHVLQNVGGVQENAHGAAERDSQEDEEEETIQHSGHVLPVIQDLKPDTFYLKGRVKTGYTVTDCLLSCLAKLRCKV